MNDTGAARGTWAAPAVSRGRALSITLWVLQVLLALQFVIAGLAKVGGDPAMVEMFATIGIGQWFRYTVGALEIAGAVGVLNPRLLGLAALGLVCLMAGATLTDLFVLGASPLLTVGLLVVGSTGRFELAPLRPYSILASARFLETARLVLEEEPIPLRFVRQFPPYHESPARRAPYRCRPTPKKGSQLPHRPDRPSPQSGA